VVNLELKDVILSTLNEIEKDSKEELSSFQKQSQNHKKEEIKQYSIDEKDSSNLPPFVQKKQHIQEKAQPQSPINGLQKEEIQTTSLNTTEEIKYLENMRERMLVLFEGLQSPNNKNIEAKLDLTINFLEYILSTLDERLDKLKKG